MARFGRGQPHAPIFLRAPLVAAVVAAATISPLHVVLARRPAAYGKHTTVAYVRPSPSSLVPDRLAPQFHIILSGAPLRQAARDADVLILRNPPAPAVVPAATGSPLHVVTLAQFRRAIRPDGLVLYVRPNIASVVPDRLPVQIHVLQQNRRRADGAAVVVVLRNPSSPVITPDRLPPQIHVASPVVWRRAIRPDGSVAYIRPSPTSLVPAQLAPAIHVITQVGSRIRVAREPVLVLLRGGQPPLISIALSLQIEDRSGFLHQLLDQSTKRYLVAEQSVTKLSTENT